MRGGVWRRGLLALVAAALVFGPAGPALGAPAPAPSGAPDVVGLPVTEATRVLAEWNKAVLFVYEPSAELTVDRADVVVARVTWRTTPGTFVAAQRPAVTLTLGRRVPDLGGLTRAQAEGALKPLEFVLVATPPAAAETWVVRSQLPAVGTIVEFTPNNAVSVTLADPTRPEERWFGLPRATAIALGGSFAALLIVLLVLGSLLVRRAVRRRAGPDAAAAEHVEVRVLAGQVVGPELSIRNKS
jgi:hypothetical protein